MAPCRGEDSRERFQEDECICQSPGDGGGKKERGDQRDVIQTDILVPPIIEAFAALTGISTQLQDKIMILFLGEFLVFSVPCRSLFQCLSTIHFEAFGNYNHIW